MDGAAGTVIGQEVPGHSPIIHNHCYVTPCIAVFIHYQQSGGCKHVSHTWFTDDGWHAGQHLAAFISITFPPFVP